MPRHSRGGRGACCTSACFSEAVSDARQALEAGPPGRLPGAGKSALAQLSHTAHFANDSAVAQDWARQAQQLLASGEHGWAKRFSGPFIIDVLLASGDLTGARRSLTDGLTWARETGNWVSLSGLLFLAADLELRAGNLDDCGRNLREAIETGIRTGTSARLLLRLDLVGLLCAARGQWAEAVTIWAAFQAQMDAKGTLDLPRHAQRRQEPLREAARVLGADRTSAARERGAAMSLPATVEFALLLTDMPAPRPLAPPPEEAGLTGLSTREQELVTLVATGRTDAQIATELFISVSTVRSHLDRIRDKTSCRRRADLTRLALQAGLV